MAHWAEIDEGNIVLRVIVTDNNDSNEGYDWIVQNLGGRWIKTSYNSRGGVHYTENFDENGHLVPSGKPHLRYNFAGIGYKYDEENDAFIPPKPPTNFASNGEIKEISWILNEETFLWEPVSE